MRTAEGTSPRVSAGNTLFTLIGFSGLYLVIGNPVPLSRGPRDRARARDPRSSGSDRARAGAGRGDRVMEALWFAIVAGMLAVYVVLDGFDFGAGFLHLVRGPDRRGATHGARRHRPGVGRERGLAPRRRRRALHVAFPARVRGGLQRVLPAADAAALGASSSAASRSSSGATSPTRSGRRSGTRPSPWAARSSPSCSARRWGTSSGAFRWTAPAPSTSRSSTASGRRRTRECSMRTRCWSGCSPCSPWRGMAGSTWR